MLLLIFVSSADFNQEQETEFLKVNVIIINYGSFKNSTLVIESAGMQIYFAQIFLHIDTYFSFPHTSDQNDSRKSLVYPVFCLLF